MPNIIELATQPRAEPQTFDSLMATVEFLLADHDDRAAVDEELELADVLAWRPRTPAVDRSSNEWL